MGIILFHIPDDEKARLAAYANAHGTGMSYQIREAIRDRLRGQSLPYQLSISGQIISGLCLTIMGASQ